MPTSSSEEYEKRKNDRFIAGLTCFQAIAVAFIAAFATIIVGVVPLFSSPQKGGEKVSLIVYFVQGLQFEPSAQPVPTLDFVSTFVAGTQTALAVTPDPVETGVVGTLTPLANTPSPDDGATASAVATQVAPTMTSDTSVILASVECNWETDWELKDDGNYYWVGSPPGVEGCERVGQYGSALENIRKGATFIVDVGEKPMLLSICVGQFSAASVVDGAKCTDNYDSMPQVTGRLTVKKSVGSASGGFSVGIKIP